VPLFVGIDVLPHKVVVVVVAVASACGSDIRLGGVAAPDDGPPADEAASFVSGVYALTFQDPVQAECEGSLTGNDASFSAITRSETNLVDGTVSLETINLSAPVLRISGPSILTAFDQMSIDLTPDLGSQPPDFPQTIWAAGVEGDFGAGPLSTMQVARYFGVDGATADTPAQMDARVALLYVTSDSSGACYSMFAAVLASQ
jgi:hypothetical protein